MKAELIANKLVPKADEEKDGMVQMIQETQSSRKIQQLT